MTDVDRISGQARAARNPTLLTETDRDMATVVLTFRDISASGLSKADSRSESDPYVQFSVGGKTLRTNTLYRAARFRGDASSASWASEYSTEVSVGETGSDVEVSVFDRDNNSSDDPLGSATFKVVPTGGDTEISLPLSDPTGATLKLRVGTEVQRPLARHSPPVAPPTAGGPVVRKEIRQLSEAEGERFVAALKQMMEDVRQPMQSVVARDLHCNSLTTCN